VIENHERWIVEKKILNESENVNRIGHHRIVNYLWNVANKTVLFEATVIAVYDSLLANALEEKMVRDINLNLFLKENEKK
jgi:hypothetical protein